MPAAIDETEGSTRIKIGPGSHAGGIPIPGTRFFYQTDLNGFNSLIAIVLELIAIKIIRDGLTIMCEVGDHPLAIHHGLDYEVFLLFLDGFFTAGQQENKQKGYDNWFHKILY